MQSRYLYSIFFFLGSLVIGMMFMSFQLIHEPKTVLLDVEETSMQDDTTKIPEIQSIKNSWLGQVDANKNQKSYFFAVSEIQLELN